MVLFSRHHSDQPSSSGEPLQAITLLHRNCGFLKLNWALEICQANCLMDHHYAEILDNMSLLGNPLDGSSVEMGSSNAVYECLEKDDGGDIRNVEENNMQIVIRAENGLYVDDGDHAVQGSRLKRKRRRGPRLWREKWQKMHPWAFTRNVDGEERMFCTVCEANGHTATRNAFRKQGSTNFQQSALATHANSSAHKTAIGTQKARAEAGKAGTNGKARGKTVPTADHGAVANHLINIANKLSSLVTREDLESLKADLRFMIHCQDARRINASCALTDPLMPVPIADGIYPDNLPNSLAELVKIPNDHVDSLLVSYGLPKLGHLDAKVRRLKAHLGFQ